MQRTIRGRLHGDRDALIERLGASRSTLAALWAARAENGHPEAVSEGRRLWWDLEQWDAWYAGYRRQQREAAHPVQRSGDLDELLRPAEQARFLGISESAISHYRARPPKGWPPPASTELTRSGRARELRTRRQLIAYRDQASRTGVAGRKPGPQPPRKAHPYEGDPRLELARTALSETPDAADSQLAARLAETHGGSTRTWQRILAVAHVRCR